LERRICERRERRERDRETAFLKDVLSVEMV